MRIYDQRIVLKVVKSERQQHSNRLRYPKSKKMPLEIVVIGILISVHVLSAWFSYDNEYINSDNYKELCYTKVSPTSTESSIGIYILLMLHFAVGQL